MRKLLAEAIGTFILVFAGTGAIMVNAISGGAITHAGVAMVFGLVVMAMIYAVGEVSGAHLNPAVTIGFAVARRFPVAMVLPYVTFQLAGAIVASALLRLLFGNVASLGATLPGAGGTAQSFGLEIILSAILMFVVLCVSQGPKETGILAGIAIGGTVGLEAMFAGPISGASMNPARSLAPAIVSGQLASVWVYLVSPVIGSIVAVGCWTAIRNPKQS